MHGRVRVRRTEEQEKLLKQKKDKAESDLRCLLNVIFDARNEKRYTPKELDLIESALNSNSDMSTMWNYRREIIESMSISDEYSEDDRIKLMNHELTLTTQYLMKNPKSYSLWFHRLWVMNNHPKPNWNDEVLFCNNALSIDERNFHCWDYRRFIVSKGKVQLKEELAFTEASIESNMSNYSAWHYRGELLSSLDPTFEVHLPFSPPPSKDTDELIIPLTKSSILKDEVELVHNAIYTDPNDQSPWFYYWWLLGRGNKRAYLRELFISRPLQRIVLVFTSAKSFDAVRQLDVRLTILYPDNTSIKLTPKDLGDWQSALPEQISAVWWLPISAESLCINLCGSSRPVCEFSQLKFDVAVCIPNIYGSSEIDTRRNPNCPTSHIFCVDCTLNVGQNESLTRVDLDPLRLLNRIVSPLNEPDDLRNELETVRDLISLEPNNKWALLTYIDLLRFIRPEDYVCDSSAAFTTLKRIDPNHSTYYTTLQSLHDFQDSLVSVYNTKSREFSLSGLHLSTLPYLDWLSLMTKLDLSQNSLVRLPTTLSYLVCLCELILDDNLLSKLEGINHLPALHTLSVRRNQLHDFASIADILSCPKLHHIHIDGNQVTELADFTNLLAEHPNVKTRKQSFVWTYDKPLNT